MSYQHLFVSFQGRITRGAYWVACLVFFGLNIVVSLLGTRAIEGTAGGLIILLAWLLIGYSGAAVAAKRWHDRNKSGWWSLIAFVPVIGLVWMIVENGFLPGTPGPNRFGPAPVKAAKPSKPIPVSYQGQTYYRHSDASFTDRSGSLVRSAALLAALGTAYVAMQAANTWDNHTSDYSSDDNSATADATAEAGDRNSGWSWFSGGESGSDNGGGGGGD